MEGTLGVVLQCLLCKAIFSSVYFIDWKFMVGCMTDFKICVLLLKFILIENVKVTITMLNICSDLITKNKVPFEKNIIFFLKLKQNAAIATQVFL